MEGVRLEFRLLGPTLVLRDGHAVGLTQGRQLSLLVYLLLNRNRTVSTARLIDELWSGAPPPTAGTMLHGYVSRLRRELGNGEGGADALRTTDEGYLLRVAEDQLDSVQFERLLDTGRQRLERGDHAGALWALDEAAGWWRGPALAEVADRSFARVDAERLEELRLAAEEERVEARLGLGDHVSLLGDLKALVERNPLRERLRAQLMLALYRSDRQVEALEVYRETRRLFAEEYGIEPGLRLRELERRILQQDPELTPRFLAPPDVGVAEPPARRRRAFPRKSAFAGMAVVLLGAVVLVSTRGEHAHGAAPARIAAGSVAVVGGTGEVAGSAAVGGDPELLAAGRAGRVAGAFGVADRSLVAVSVGGVRVGRPASLGVTPGGLAVGAGSVWVSDAGGSAVMRVDPAYGTVDRVRLPGVGPLGSLAFGAGSLWAADYGLFTRPTASDGIARIDPVTGRLQARIAVWQPGALAFGAGALWIGRSGAILRLDPATNRVEGSVRLAGEVSGVTLGGGYVWARTESTLWQIEPNRPTVVRGYPIPSGRGELAWVRGSVWVADAGTGALVEVDPATGTATRHRVGGSPISLAAGGGTLFAGVGRHVAGATGSGTPVIDLEAQPTVDPAFSFDPDSWRIAHATCSTLLTYADASGKLIPDAAAAMPTIEDGGRVYRFRIRRGVRFSPPSGAPLDARAFAASLERALSPALGRNAVLAQTPFLSDVVGARAFQSGAATSVRGISAHGDVLTIRLRHPAGDLSARLAMPTFCAVPPGTPATRGGIKVPIPTAGPFYVASMTPSQLLLRRNPNYTGPRAGRVPALEVETNVEPDVGASAVLRGRADYAENSSVRHLSPLYARDGPLAGHAPTTRPHARQIAGRRIGIQFLELNTRRGVFRSRRMRAAVNDAIDRRALAGAAGGLPTGEYLPAAVPGSSSAPVFPLRPDLRRARALAGRGGRAVVLTRELSSCPLCAADVGLLRDELARIGITVVVKQVPEPAVSVLNDPHLRWDVAFDNWLFDYPDASDIAPLLSARGNQDVAGLEDRAVDRGLARASGLAGAARAAAYRRVTERLERRDRPWAVYASIAEPAIVGPRLACVADSPELGIDLARLCLRHPA
jgi:DNA-binding SARP family transcriptional activator/ABC-type oligopeptide transport system substrate-binding subunit/streptogramin lyase